MRRLPPALMLLVLALAAVADARRHRYGQSARKYQQSRARMSRYEYMDDYDEEEEEVNPSLEAIENEVIESVKKGRDKRDWPPKWTGPIVGFGTLWYVSFFFS